MSQLLEQLEMALFISPSTFLRVGKLHGFGNDFLGTLPNKTSQSWIFGKNKRKTYPRVPNLLALRKKSPNAYICACFPCAYGSGNLRCKGVGKNKE
jgi:hypothetical protein